jgi:hypothetical protein
MNNHSAYILKNYQVLIMINPNSKYRQEMEGMTTGDKLLAQGE